MLSKTAMVSCLLLVGVMGCESQPIDGAPDAGTWRWSRLVRVYEVSLVEAYDAARDLIERQGWKIDEVHSGSTRAEIDLEAGGDIEINIQMRTLSPGRTEIGIDAGSRLESLRVFRLLDELLVGAGGAQR